MIETLDGRDDRLAELAVPGRPRHPHRHGGQWPTHVHKARRRRADARRQRIQAHRATEGTP